MQRALLSLLSAFALVLAGFTSVGSPATAAQTQVQRITGSDSVAVAAKVSQDYPSGQAVTFVVGAEAHADALVAATRAGGINAPIVLVNKNSIPTATRQALERLGSDRIVIAGGEGAVSADVATQLGDYAQRGVERVSGSSRYETAANMAKKYDSNPERVYLAGGEGHADAIAGAALAGHERLPMLLARSAGLDSSTVAELQRLKPKEIVVLGGTGVVPNSVAQQAASYSTSGKYSRIAGSDRYATAAEIAKKFPQGSSGLYVAGGTAYSEALVAATRAARAGQPLILTKPTTVPSATWTAINHHDPNIIYAVGTSQSVGDEVVEELASGGSRRPVVPAPVPPPADPIPPTTGAPMIGGYLGAPNENPDQRFRDNFGAWPDLASTYYQAEGRGGGKINRAHEQARIDRGTIPVLTVTSVNGPYTMKQIGSGQADGWIDYWANELAALDGEVWFTFDHEFEVKLNQNKWSPAPTLNEYVGAYNRFYTRVKAKAPNVKFMYWYGYADQAKIDVIGAGIHRPDIIALDPYVFSHHSPTTTFEQMAQPKLNWLRNRGWYDDQPIIFAEFAKDTRHGDGQVASFLTDLRPRMDALGVTGVIYFNRNVSSNNAIKGLITDGNWPQARQALRGSVTSN